MAARADRLGDYRSELEGSAQARDVARYLLIQPPMPLVARGPYGVVAAASVGLMPPWTRIPLRLPFLPLTETFAVRPAATAVTRTLRWAMS